jgi:hypothetical protein
MPTPLFLNKRASIKTHEQSIYSTLIVIMSCPTHPLGYDQLRDDMDGLSGKDDHETTSAGRTAAATAASSLDGNGRLIRVAFKIRIEAGFTCCKGIKIKGNARMSSGKIYDHLSL